MMHLRLGAVNCCSVSHSLSPSLSPYVVLWVFLSLFSTAIWVCWSDGFGMGCGKHTLTLSAAATFSSQIKNVSNKRLLVCSIAYFCAHSTRAQRQLPQSRSHSSSLCAAAPADMNVIVKLTSTFSSNAAVSRSMSRASECDIFRGLLSHLGVSS